MLRRNGILAANLMPMLGLLMGGGGPWPRLGNWLSRSLLFLRVRLTVLQTIQMMKLANMKEPSRGQLSCSI